MDEAGQKRIVMKMRASFARAQNTQCPAQDKEKKRKGGRQIEGGNNKQKRQNHSPPVPICVFGVERAALIFKRVARGVPCRLRDVKHAHTGF
jgi:hypothetical protein